MRFLILSLALLTASCAGTGSDLVDERTKQAVEDVVRVSLGAENDKDVDKFLELWTDEGLSEYDVGTRAELKAGKESNFGADPVDIVRFSGTSVRGGKATTTVDTVVGRHLVAFPLTRVRFELIERENVGWMLNGFQFIGGAPPTGETDIVDIQGREYAFVLDRDEVPGEIAFKFSNEGKEPHEITIFKGPDDLTVDRAREELKDVSGHDLKGIPDGYRADHLSFAEPGKSVDVSFDRPLPRGLYVLACYIPQGGFDEHGESHVGAKSHFELGMVKLLGVS